MSRIKFILLLLVAFCITTLSFGQQTTKPAKCTNPGSGILVGGFFSVSPGIGCLDFQTNSATVTALNPVDPTGGTNFTDLGYIFNFKDGDNLVIPRPLETQKTFTTPGTYWILQNINVSSVSYITCNSFELIQTEVPDVKINSCGAQDITVTFLNTPKNKTHAGYRIVWGDGKENFIDGITANSFPLDVNHTYTSPLTTQPQIVANYTRGGSLVVCRSSPFPFNAQANTPPKIKELEGLTGGTSNKITMIEGVAGTEYTIEQKTKTGSWTDTGRKITRNTGETFKTETITGLNASTEYCFRVKTKDLCNNDIPSNEVCTIIPKQTLTSPNEVKIDWNAPLPTVTRYTVGYSENPTGANANTGSPVTATATTFSYNQLVCTKKYNFQVTAEVGTGVDVVKIKSPTIIVDPSNSPKLVPSTIGLVSVINPDLIRFNVFEVNGAITNKYVFYRSEGNSPTFTEIHRSSNNSYEDTNVETSKQQYCYKVAYEDQCGNVSDQSPAYCNVFLTSKERNTLNWTPGAEITPVVKSIDYRIETIDENGNITSADRTPDLKSNVGDLIETLLNQNTNGEAEFRIRGIITLLILVQGTPVEFQVEVYSNTYTFISPARLYVPSAFSPNGDSFNDEFIAQGRYIAEFNLEVYDRWGNVIFESRDLDIGWKGTASDGTSPAPAGNYGFKIFGLDLAGREFEKVGSVTLLR
ncbi:MAG: gliding motility-associated C-terminal domain-containing protein [Emticicia sp.]|uniref:T9SS type B sorting domain-containing protein n=1 Tax=Emticicia sp. TaxID=1930953 RepID=UPI003BA7BE91